MDKIVKAQKDKVVIPTYGLGTPEVNPVFFEKRVYQGSSGKIYPVPLIDKVFDTKEDKYYDAAFKILEILLDIMKAIIRYGICSILNFIAFRIWNA